MELNPIRLADQASESCGCICEWSWTLSCIFLIYCEFLCKGVAKQHFVDISLDMDQMATCQHMAEKYRNDNCEIQCYGEADGLDIVHMRMIFHESDVSSKARKRAIRHLQTELDQTFNVSSSHVFGPLSRSKRMFPYSYTSYGSGRSRPTGYMTAHPEQQGYTIPHQMPSMYGSMKWNRIGSHHFERRITTNFDDPWYPLEWYCNDGENSGMNLLKAWRMGYSGKGVSICILDDGLDYRHPDLSRRYRRDISHDFNDLADIYRDPMPSSFDGDNSHGTKCAGVAAAEANNGLCGVGAAFNAFIGAHRVLDGVITALTEGRSLAYRNQITDIKSLSWGPTDDGKSMEKPNIFSLRALENGGRNGLGTLFVWASGNGGRNGDHCGADAYVSNQNVLAIGSVNKRGGLPFFTEYCPAVLAVAYTGGNLGNDSRYHEGIGGGCVTTDVLGKCCSDFVGTSAAAPLAAGIFALVLEANPRLTYRDVMHIVTQTARIPGSKADESWRVNGAGYLVSERYGFGVMDAARMVETALTWTNVEPRRQCEIPTIQFDENQGRISSGGVFTTTIGVASCPNVEALEHVIVYLTMSYPYRGDIKVTVISPAGTESVLLEYRPLDDSSSGIKYFPLMTTHCWGESPVGLWRVRVDAKDDLVNFRKGHVKRIGLRLFGTKRWMLSRFYQRTRHA